MKLLNIYNPKGESLQKIIEEYIQTYYTLEQEWSN